MATPNDFCQWLDDACQQVQQLEQQGKAHLANNDTPAYVACMRQKAEFLANLFRAAGPMLNALPDTIDTAPLAAQLQRFSRSAQNALDLDSVFYMSALLYPEVHVEGRPNDLQVFAAACRQRLCH